MTMEAKMGSVDYCTQLQKAQDSRLPTYLDAQLFTVSVC